MYVLNTDVHPWARICKPASSDKLQANSENFRRPARNFYFECRIHTCMHTFYCRIMLPVYKDYSIVLQKVN